MAAEVEEVDIDRRRDEALRLLNGGQPHGTTPDRPIIELKSGELHTYAVKTEEILSPDVYVRGGRLVRIGQSQEIAGLATQAIRRDASQPTVLPASAEYLRRRLTEVADFRAWRKREKVWAPVDCPRDLAANILGAGDWPRFRALTAIATAPFIRPDLTVCESPGYDKSTGIYYQPSGTFPRVPRRPSFDDAERAREVLLAPFSEIPFESPASFSVFATYILTTAIRASLGATPVIFITSPAPGTGKTLASRMPPLIATGSDAPLRPYTDDGEELRKVLFASLLAGDLVLVFDNVPNGVKVRSPILCGFATATTYGDRKLGTSESQGLPNRTQILLTGNNITPTGDLARRSLVCRLDVNAESARGRNFTIPDLPAYVAANRPDLLVAALTIITAYIAAGTPRVARPLESFEQWSRLVRDPLVWLGMEDPVATQETETDDETESLRGAFKALWDTYESRAFTALVIAESVGTVAQEMKAAIETAGCADATNSTMVGYWLRANRDRVADGRKLIATPGHAGVKRWTLQTV